MSKRIGLKNSKLHELLGVSGPKEQLSRDSVNFQNKYLVQDSPDSRPSIVPPIQLNKLRSIDPVDIVELERASIM